MAWEPQDGLPERATYTINQINHTHEQMSLLYAPGYMKSSLVLTSITGSMLFNFPKNNITYTKKVVKRLQNM